LSGQRHLVTEMPRGGANS